MEIFKESSVSRIEPRLAECKTSSPNTILYAWPLEGVLIVVRRRLYIGALYLLRSYLKPHSEQVPLSLWLLSILIAFLVLYCISAINCQSFVRYVESGREVTFDFGV